MNWENITVSSKILGHISAGVYRTAGGALKELVSNAFDANATRVVITTNHPSFDIISCRDNGSGIRVVDFQRIMRGGIGDSLKRVDGDRTSNLSRPVIGRLGIGMLGIAQVCHQFKIISHHRETRSAFQATVKLIDYLREKLDEVNPEDEEQHDVGHFAIDELEYDQNQVGTYVVAADMRSAFVRKFREHPGSPLPSKFHVFIDSIHKEKSVRELGNYWQMVWDLALACPIPYIEDGSFNWGKISAPPEAQENIDKLQAELKDYNFELIVDGLSLRKPVTYPWPSFKRDGEEAMLGKLFPIDEEMKVYGRILRLFGYVYLQDGQAIEPMELRGILIRIRNIAIGSYDSTFLGYPKIEGPRFNWLSGEVYVNDGLEHALNIDRDSFNEMHPHFVALQQRIHKLLQDVFQRAGEGVKIRSLAKREREERRRLSALQQLVSNELQDKYRILESGEIHSPIVIDDKQKKILVNEEDSLWPKPRSKRELAKLIAIAFELSLLAPSAKRREKFYRLLSQILDL
jgi:hypothetical protein